MAVGLELSGSAALTGLTPSDVGELERVAIAEEYAAGDTIFTEGEPSLGMHIIVSGEVSLRTSLGVEQVDVAEAGKGDLIGWSGLVPPHAYSATAVSVGASTLAFIKTDDLMRLSEEDQYLGKMLMRNVASVISVRLRESHERTAHLVQQLRGQVPSGKGLRSRHKD